VPLRAPFLRVYSGLELAVVCWGRLRTIPAALRCSRTVSYSTRICRSAWPYSPPAAVTSTQRPYRERESHAPGLRAEHVDQPLAVLCRHIGRRARTRCLAQPFDIFGEVALESAPHCLLARTNELVNLRNDRAPLGGQQDHLGARPQARAAVDTVPTDLCVSIQTLGL
jgi:hypothetical protein